MYTADALIDLHERAHRSLTQLLQHCRALTPDELDREHLGFGYPSVRLQLHHGIGAEEYWIGVLGGRVEADDNEADYPTVATLESYRAEVFEGTEQYLRGASDEDLNTPRDMRVWGGNERRLMPAHVVLRTCTHLYQHQGQVVAMCRLLGQPVPPGLDFPLV